MCGFIFYLWQVAHSFINFFTLCLMPCHQNWVSIRWKDLLTPSCPAVNVPKDVYKFGVFKNTPFFLAQQAQFNGVKMNQTWILLDWTVKHWSSSSHVCSSQISASMVDKLMKCSLNRDKAYLAVLFGLFLYSMEKSEESSITTHLCCIGLDTLCWRRYFKTFTTKWYPIK